MITLAIAGSSALIITGNDASSIVNSNSSSSSTMSSGMTEILNIKLLNLAGIVTLYGPGS